MDRERLQEVHQTDLTESRINEDFLDWLKTKGPSWLLVIMVGVAAYMGLIRWKQHKRDYVSQAWAEFVACRLPGSFEDVAARYDDVPGLPQLAMRMAADTLLGAVQTGRPLGGTTISTEPATFFSGEELQEYLDRADRLYRDVLEADDLSLAMTLHAVSAMNGRAATAESRGDVAEARRWYEEAARRAEEYYPDLATQARGRAATVDVYADAVILPRQEDLPQSEPESREPVEIEEALRDLLLSDASESG